MKGGIGTGLVLMPQWTLFLKIKVNMNTLRMKNTFKPMAVESVGQLLNFKILLFSVRPNTFIGILPVPKIM